MFSFVETALNVKTAEKLYLVRMNRHLRLTDTCNEISVAAYQRGNVGNKRRANPTHLTKFLLTPVFQNFALWLIISVDLKFSL